MFSEDWDIEKLDNRAAEIIDELIDKGQACFKEFTEGGFKLPASSNIDDVEHVLVVCSGYPERTGAWSYTLLEQSMKDSTVLAQVSMEPYFPKDLSQFGVLFINPNAPELQSPPEASIPEYLRQLTHVFEVFAKQQKKICLMGYSLGGDVILRFLQENIQCVEQTGKLIFVDPSPPSLGRRKLKPEVLSLVEQAFFVGLGDKDGNPGEFAEFTKMRLKIKPKLVHCESHGAIPNVVQPMIWDVMKKWIEGE